MKIPHFISSTVLRHLDCFYGFAITSSTPVSVSAQASWCMCVPKSFPTAERGSAITGSRVQQLVLIDSADLFSQVVVPSYTPPSEVFVFLLRTYILTCP